MGLDDSMAEHPDVAKVAVVVDVDETVLNNAMYEAWLIEQGISHSGSTPQKRVDAAAAPALPGAIDFFRYVEQKGAEAFYATNRSEAKREGTLKNLQSQSFPFAGQMLKPPLKRSKTGRSSVLTRTA